MTGRDSDNLYITLTVLLTAPTFLRDISQVLLHTCLHTITKAHQPHPCPPLPRAHGSEGSLRARFSRSRRIASYVTSTSGTTPLAHRKPCGYLHSVSSLVLCMKIIQSDLRRGIYCEFFISLFLSTSFYFPPFSTPLIRKVTNKKQTGGYPYIRYLIFEKKKKSRLNYFLYAVNNLFSRRSPHLHIGARSSLCLEFMKPENNDVD